MSAIGTLTPTSLCNKLSNLPFSNTPIPIQIPTLFPSKPKPHKALALKTQFSSFSLLSLPLFRTPASASFDGFESEKDSEEEDPESEEYAEEDEQRVSNSAEDGRLYVGNLPYSMNSAQLGDVFAEAGRVVKVEVVYDRVTDRSRGFGFVTMGSVEEAKQAIRMFDGSQVGGRTVKVNFPEVPRGGEREVMGPKIRRSDQAFVDSPHKIYAGNLGWGLSSQNLRDAFAGQPGLLSAKVIYDRNSGRSRGFGFVTFESADDVEAALEAMNGVEVEGRPLRLNVAAERAPLSPPSLGSSAENNLDSSELLSSIIT